MAAVRLWKDCYFFVMRNSMVFPSAYSFALRSECTDLAERQRFAYRTARILTAAALQ